MALEILNIIGETKSKKKSEYAIQFYIKKIVIFKLYLNSI